jgi:hypothetical protein
LLNLARRSLPRMIALTAVVVGACATAAPPASLGPSSSAETAGVASPAGTAVPAASASIEPTSSLPADLGPAPVVEFPAVQVLGIGTITLSKPATAPVHFWLACEWSTTEQVSWIYPRSTRLLGEVVHPDLTIGADTAFSIGREGDVAGYFPSEATTEVVEHDAEWTTATVTFGGLSLNPEVWSGPFPTPRAAFERPLGGNAAAASLDGTVSWSCGQRPANVPTPGPSVSPEPEPSFPFDHLPDATLHADGNAQVGRPGCGVSWEGYGNGGGESCGPSYQVLADDRAVHATSGRPLRLTLPSGFHFTSWSMSWIDQATAEYYRDQGPPTMHHRDGEQSIDSTAISLAALGKGDWSVLIEWSGTDGKLRVMGQRDYFRVIVR